MAGLFTLVWPAGPAQALDPSLNLTQYGHRTWRVGEAGLEDAPLTISQTLDGQIWVGTANGLYAFDGKQFRRWRPVAGAPVNLGSIGQIFGDREGSLLVGSSKGLFRIKGGGLFRYPFPTVNVGHFLEDKAGTIWFSDSGNDQSRSVCSVKSRTVQCYGPRQGLACKTSHAFSLDAQGNMWIGSSKGVCRWRPGTRSLIYPLGSVFQIVSDEHKSSWASVDLGSTKTGLWHFANGAWRRFDAPNFDSHRMDIWTMFADRQGAVWVGGPDFGLYRVYQDHVTHFDRSNGLTGDEVDFALQDQEGSVWIATTEGIDQFYQQLIVPENRYTGSPFASTYWVSPMAHGGTVVHRGATVDRLTEDGRLVQSVKLPAKPTFGPALATRNGGIYVGADGGLFLIRHGHARQVPIDMDFRTHTINDLAEDARGAVWVGGKTTSADMVGGWLERVDPNGQVRRLPSPVSGEEGVLYILASDLAGGVWGATYGAGLFHWQHGQVDHVQGLSGTFHLIGQIFPVAAGTAWLATQRGAVLIENGRVRTLDASNGLPCVYVYGAALDQSRNLWLTMSCGLVRVAAAELERWRLQPHSQIRTTAFGVTDGYYGKVQSRIIRSNAGKLWFAGGDGVYVVDPARIPTNSMAPPLQIENIEADRHSFPAAPEVTLSKLNRNLEVDYTAFSFIQPDLLTFRYRLIGYDQNWINAGSRRQAFYTDLPPGSFRFQVTGCNKDGACNERGASVILVVPPAWWQTWLFRT